MLNQPVLRYLEQAEGRVWTSVYSKVTGISDRTLRKKRDLSPDTIKKAQQHSREYLKQQFLGMGYSAEEFDAWLAPHPGNSTQGMLYSELVYSYQIEGFIAYPHTIELAIAIDRLSASLTEARQRNDVAGFKKVLLNSGVVGPEHFARNAAERRQATAPPLLESLHMAQEWAEINQPFQRVAMNTLYSFLARWDVEFCSQQFKSRIPRSCFATLLPRLNSDDSITPGGVVSKRRGLLVTPVRRFIDLMACVGEFVRKNKWPDQIPQVRRIALDANEPYQNLVNWRDGTKSFTRRDFAQLWQHLCPDREGANVTMRAHEPWPLFVATMFWQALLIQASATSKRKTIYLVEDDYLTWWERHYQELQAKGLAFGSAPWPACFNEI